MAVVYVAHVEGGAVAVEASGTERGQLALVRELRDGVGLIHELRQLRGAEEFADHRRNGAHVDEPRRGNFVGILRRHALFDEPFKARDAHAQLILQKLAHAAHAAVAEVVDIVDGADAVAEVEVGRNGGDHVVYRDVPVVELVDEGADNLFLLCGDGDLLTFQNFMELFARLAEFDAVFLPLLAVFALFLLLVVRLFRFGGEIDGVDAVAELFGDRLGVGIFHRRGDLLGEFKVRIINGRQKPKALRVL